MKRWISLLVCFGMIMSVLPGVAAQDAQLAVGQSVNGFTVRALGAIDIVGAKTTLFEHEKSGAQLFFIENSDINRAFDIVFKTPVLDNTGAPHVFEHATISGSEKYPSKDVFFSMSNATYNTYANALTTNTSTMYPLASLSEEQLLTMMDVYMDGVFNPLLMTEPMLLSREAWRYELADVNSPITLNGTVYSEMKGANNISSTANTNLIRTLFPGSIAGNNPGGELDSIPELTYEQLVNFHETYYHPSNAMIILYGDLDYARFLKALDEDYLCHYDKCDIEVKTGLIDMPSGLATADFEFAVERDTPKDDGSIVQYAFALDGITSEDKYGYSVLTDILIHESSPLTAAIREALPGVNFVAAIDNQHAMPYVLFQLMGANPVDAETLRSIVDEHLGAFSQDGFDPEIIKAVIAQYRLSTLTMTEVPNLGVNLCISTGLYWSQDGTLNYFDDFVNALSAMDEKADDGYFEGLVAQLNAVGRRALVTTAPVPGLAEEKAAQLAEKLAAYKATLTDEQIAKMVEDTKAYAEWNAVEIPQEIVQKMQAVTVDSLPEERPTYALTDEVEGGVRRMTAKAEVDQIGLTEWMFSTDFVDVQDVPYLSLYGQLLGSMPTEKYTRDQVSQLLWQQLSEFYVSPSTQLIDGQDAPLYRFKAQWMSLMDHYAEDVALVDEVLFHTDFSDTAELAKFVMRKRASMKQMINANSMQIQMLRANALYNPEAAYQLMTSGLVYYEFLGEVEALLQTQPEAIVAKLESIQRALPNRTGALSIFAGNEAGIEVSEPVLDAYFAGLPETVHTPADYSGIELPMMREAMVVDSQLQFNMLHASLEALGLERDGRYAPVAALISDMYLVPVLRHQMGVYTPMLSVGREDITLLTYRDPNLAETFKVYDGIADFVRTLSLDQAQVDPYILSSYSVYAMPNGQLNGAIAAIHNQLKGDTDEVMIEYMRQIKSLKAEDIASFADLFDRLSEMGARSTSGAQSAIEQDAGLFDQILTPLAEAQGASESDQAA